MSEKDLWEVKLIDRVMLTEDIMVLKFDRPADFIFSAGQFVRFFIQDQSGEFWRSYSICSTPDKDYLEFCVRILPGGKASELFSALIAGESVKISKAAGVFVAPIHNSHPMVLVGTGTGIAPLKSLVEHSLMCAKQSSLTLIFGLRNEADIFWKDKFEEMAQKFSNFNFILTLSQAEANWHGARGRVTDHIIGYLDPKAFYYLCGGAPMVKDVRSILVKHQVDTKNIRLEVY